MSDSFVTPWTVAHEAPLSMEFSRLECRSGLPFPPPGDLPNPEIEPLSLMSPALTGGFFTTSHTWKATKPSKRPEKTAWVCLRGRDESRKKVWVYRKEMVWGNKSQVYICEGQEKQRSENNAFTPLLGWARARPL